MSAVTPAPDTYQIEYRHFGRSERLAPMGRFFSLQLGEHKLTVQTSAFAKDLKCESPFLMACLHVETEHGERRFLGVVASTRVHSANATIGDLKALVASVKLHQCVDCRHPYVLDPVVPERHICWTCYQLRRNRLAGSLLMAESSHLKRRLEAIEQAEIDGMTHVVIRRKRMKLSLERFASVPAALRTQLCTLEVTRFTVDKPPAEDLESIFAVYKGPLHSPAQAVILSLQEYRDQTNMRQGMLQNVMRTSNGLRDRAGVSLMKEIQRLKHPSTPVSPSRATPARARPKRVSILRQLAELAK